MERIVVRRTGCHPIKGDLARVVQMPADLSKYSESEREAIQAACGNDDCDLAVLEGDAEGTVVYFHEAPGGTWLPISSITRSAWVD